MRLGSKLILGFALVLVVSTVVTVFGIVYMDKLADTTETMFNHPYRASTTALEAQSKVVTMGREMRDIVLASDQKVMESHVQRVDELHEEVLGLFDLLYEAFMGDPALLDAALKAFTDWKPIREQVIQSYLIGQRDRAAEITRTQGTPQLELIETSIQRVVDDAKLRAENYHDEARQNAVRATSVVVGLLISAYAVAALAAFFITRSITKPVRLLVGFTGEIARGNLGVEVVDYQSKDEIGVLTAALNEMRSDVREMVNSVRDVRKSRNWGIIQKKLARLYPSLPGLPIRPIS